MPASYYLPAKDTNLSTHLTAMNEQMPISAVTLQAVTNVYNIKVTVLTHDGCQHIIRPYPPQVGMAQLHLGHIVGNKLVVLQCKYII